MYINVKWGGMVWVDWTVEWSGGAGGWPGTAARLSQIGTTYPVRHKSGVPGLIGAASRADRHGLPSQTKKREWLDCGVESIDWIVGWSGEGRNGRDGGTAVPDRHGLPSQP